VKRPKRQIIAMGGGGFSVQPNLALDRYVLAQSRKRIPSVCFLATASGDASTYIARFYAAYTKLRCRPSHVALFERTPELKQVLLAQDVIYVGGGNTKSMLGVWREWGIPSLLKQAWRSGIVLAGISAGAICWFEVGVTDSWAGRLAPLPCLGLLPGTGCPHYDGEPERRPALHKMLRRPSLPPALALDDGTAAHFVGRRLLRIVASRPTAFAYHVRSESGARAVETVLPVVRLPRYPAA
jgi:peptidase E